MIDWKRIEDLRSEIGEDDFMEVVDMFLNEADEVVDGMIALSDLGQVEGQLHFLKGSALNLGLADLAVLCQTGERTAAAGNPALVDLGQVAKVYATSKLAILAGLGRSIAA